VAVLLLLAVAAAYEPVPEAIAVSVSGAGFDRLGRALADVMPESFSIGGLDTEFVCDEADPTAALALTIGALDVLIHFDQIELVPSRDRLDVALYGAIDSTPTTLTASGSCPPLTSLEEVCSVELGTTPIEAHFGLELSLIEGVVDATVDELTVTLGAIGNPVDGCTVASAIGTLLGQNPLALTDLLQSQIDPSLADLGPTIEAAVEDGLAGLVIDTSFALGEAEVGLSIEPTALELDSDGLVLVLGAQVSQAGSSDCVPEATPPYALPPLPVLDGNGPGDLAYDIGAVVNRTFVDQILFGVYASGGLCIDAGALGGITLDTSLLGAAFGDDWAALFPDAQPVDLLIAPTRPPTIRFEEDGPPVRLDLNGLGLQAFSELDGRSARIFAITLEGEVDIDVDLADGVLTPSLIIDPVLLDMTEVDHELLGPGYAAGLETFLPTILDAALPADLLPTFALPDFNGIGVEALWLLPAQAGDWLGAWLTLDVDHVRPIELAGCEGGSFGCDGDTGPELDLGTALGCSSEDGGCGGDALGCGGDSGCGGDGGCGGSSGCATVPVRPVMFGFALLGALWRRRRET
jgi:hypothetical protein